MTDSPHQDERAILAALEALEDDGESAHRSPAEGEDRAYAELWGLLPFTLEPVAPSSHVKAQVMESIHRPDLGPRSAPPPPPPPLHSSAPRPAGDPSPPRAGVPARRWMLPLAAALAALALGASAWLYLQVGVQRSEIARLESALSSSEERAATLEASRGRLEEQLALVATPGMEVCPLSPMEAVTEGARGVVFMDPAGGRWLLRVRDLGPAPEGRMYTLWFMGSDGDAMRGGNLEPMAEDSYQLAAEGMPDTMTGIAVTLESDEAAQRPSGPTVLFGNERFSI